MLVTLFGHKIPAPILFAPIGINKLYSPEGELVPARVAGELGLPVGFLYSIPFVHDPLTDICDETAALDERVYCIETSNTLHRSHSDTLGTIEKTPWWLSHNSQLNKQCHN